MAPTEPKTGTRGPESGPFFRKMRHLLLAGMSTYKVLAWRCSQAIPRPQPCSPAVPQARQSTIFSKRRPLAWPRSSRRAVSRSPHSGFLWRWEVQLWLAALAAARRPPARALPPASQCEVKVHVALRGDLAIDSKRLRGQGRVMVG